MHKVINKNSDSEPIFARIFITTDKKCVRKNIKRFLFFPVSIFYFLNLAKILPKGATEFCSAFWKSGQKKSFKNSIEEMRELIL